MLQETKIMKENNFFEGFLAYQNESTLNLAGFQIKGICTLFKDNGIIKSQDIYNSEDGRIIISAFKIPNDPNVYKITNIYLEPTFNETHIDISKVYSKECIEEINSSIIIAGNINKQKEFLNKVKYMNRTKCIFTCESDFISKKEIIEVNKSTFHGAHDIIIMETILQTYDKPEDFRICLDENIAKENFNKLIKTDFKWKLQNPLIYGNSFSCDNQLEDTLQTLNNKIKYVKKNYNQFEVTENLSVNIDIKTKWNIFNNKYGFTKKNILANISKKLRLNVINEAEQIFGTKRWILDEEIETKRKNIAIAVGDNIKLILEEIEDQKDYLSKIEFNEIINTWEIKAPDWAGIRMND